MMPHIESAGDLHLNANRQPKLGGAGEGKGVHETGLTENVLI